MGYTTSCDTPEARREQVSRPGESSINRCDTYIPHAFLDTDWAPSGGVFDGRVWVSFSVRSALVECAGLPRVRHGTRRGCCDGLAELDVG